MGHNSGRMAGGRCVALKFMCETEQAMDYSRYVCGGCRFTHQLIRLTYRVEVGDIDLNRVFDFSYSTMHGTCIVALRDMRWILSALNLRENLIPRKHGIVEFAARGIRLLN
jgi:hypothetical protein